MAATIHDVARAANVSIATVSRVLTGNYPVAEATRARVLDAVRTLDYSANPNARRLRGADLSPIAVLLGSLTGPSFAALAQGVESEARARGRICLIGATGGDADRELELVELMRRQQAAAIVLPGGMWRDREHHDRMAQHAEALARAGMRLVFCGNRVLKRDVGDTIAIRYDNEGGAERIAARVGAAGHRSVLIMPGLTAGDTASQRLRGFQRALDAAGASVYAVRETVFDRDPAREMMLAVLDESSRDGGRLPFTAVVCGTDQMAIGVLEALRERGIRCPEDVSVTGFDDVPAARDLNPALTTVRIPYEEMGVLAVRRALDGAPDAPSTLPVDVIERSSLAAPR
ncbi:LacI family DNA-binding transcriptional regulator [Microbacterium karelineae]|uniref:LacI family DNA-binding transcriptional regulator n=1 Tax=Microbacterium karelineae TaxID=2654283 RepID=UPI0012EACB10|nr:LacI family DNA-binding transcriptional regulator [Microbacterium karelineae]